MVDLNRNKELFKSIQTNSQRSPKFGKSKTSSAFDVVSLDGESGEKKIAPKNRTSYVNLPLPVKNFLRRTFVRFAVFGGKIVHFTASCC